MSAPSTSPAPACSSGHGQGSNAAGTGTASSVPGQRHAAPPPAPSTTTSAPPATGIAAAAASASAAPGAPDSAPSAAIVALLRASKEERKGLLDIVGFAAAEGYGAELEGCLGTCRLTWADKLLNDSTVNVHHPRTRLSLACLKGRADRVAQLLSYGADVNKLVSVQELTDEKVEQYLGKGQGLKPYTCGYETYAAPVQMAAARGHVDIVRALASVTPDDRLFYPAFPAAALGLADVMQELIRRGLGIDYLTHDRGSALHVAAKAGHLDTVRVIAEAARSIDLSPPQPFSFSPITAAADGGHTAVVEYLAARPNVDLTETLVAACRVGLVDLAVSLLDRGADVNGVARFGMAPLVEATRSGNAALVHMLLERGAKPEVRQVVICLDETPDRQAITLACFLGHTAIVRDLLAHGADANGLPTGSTDSREWQQLPPIIRAAHGGHADLVRELAGLPDVRKDEALWAAAYTGLLDVVTALLGVGAGLAFKLTGVSALGAAAARGHTAVIAELIKAGAEVNPPRIDQRHTAPAVYFPPLILGAVCGQVEAVRLLCQHGADVNLWTSIDLSNPFWLSLPALPPPFDNKQNNYRILLHSPMLAATAGGRAETALFLAQQPGLDLELALQHAVYGQCPGAVVQALLDRGVDPNARMEGDRVLSAAWKSDRPAADGPTVLTMAVKWNHNEAARILIQHPRTLVQPALLSAVCYGHADLVQAMAARGSQLILDMPLAGIRGGQFDDVIKYTPLQAACLVGDKEVVRVLLEAGASATAPAEDGDPPVHLAIGVKTVGVSEAYSEPRPRPVEERAEVLRLLVAKGADLGTPNAKGVPALHLALRDKEECLPIVQALLELGADVNRVAEMQERLGHYVGGPNKPRMPLDMVQRKSKGLAELLCRQPTINPQSALVVAAAHGLADAVCELVGRGANVNKPDHRGRFALLAACTGSNGKRLAVVQVLVELGADVNVAQPLEEQQARDIFGESVSVSGPPSSHPQCAIRAASGLRRPQAEGGCDRATVCLLAAQPSIDLAEAAVAAAAADLPDVIDALAARGADFNKANAWGELPIQVAAAFCLPAIVAALIKHGASPNVTFTHYVTLPVDGNEHPQRQTVQGMTPLMAAVCSGGAKTVRALCEGGVDVGASTVHTPPAGQSSSGWGAACAPKEAKPITITASYLMWQAAGKKPAAAFSLFGADDRRRPDPRDPAAVLTYLALQPGGDPPAASMKGAVKALHTDTVSAFIARGVPGHALVEGLVEACTGTAPDAKATAIVRLLLEAGVDVNGRDSEGKTALDACNARSLNSSAGPRLLSILGGGGGSQEEGKAITTLLIRHPAIDLSQALTAACKLDSADLVREVIGRGADVSQPVPGHLQPTPVPPADAARSVEVLRALAEAPAADVTACLLRAFQVMRFNGRAGDATFARAMIERGADVNATDKDGNTVLDNVLSLSTVVSSRGETQELVQELERRGAKKTEVRNIALAPPAGFNGSFGTGFGAPTPGYGGAAGSAPFRLPAGPVSGFGGGFASAPAFGASFGGFGSAPAPAPAFGASSGGFGSAPAPAPAFGASSGGFGSAPAPAPAFGASSGGFGSAPAPAFGGFASPTATATASSLALFGGSSPAAGGGSGSGSGGGGAAAGLTPPPKKGRLSMEEALAFVDAVKAEDGKEREKDKAVSSRSSGFSFSFGGAAAFSSSGAGAAPASVASGPALYDRFTSLMGRYKAGQLTTPAVCTEVASLFAGRPALLRGFDRFLPPGHTIRTYLQGADAEAWDEEEQQTQRQGLAEASSGPASGFGAFSLGATPAPAPASGGGFSFNMPAPAAPAPSSGGGFSFSMPAPAASSPAPAAPAGGGFSFSMPAPAAPAPAHASGGGFSFNMPAPGAPAAPAGGGFSFSMPAPGAPAAPAPGAGGFSFSMPAPAAPFPAPAAPAFGAGGFSFGGPR